MPDADPLLVYPFSADEFCSRLIGQNSHLHVGIGDKNQIAYLSKYLTSLSTKTIVEETKYIDHDFLEDFSAYYVRCFKDYDRTCRRLHFFAKEFTKTEWDQLLEGTTKRDTICCNKYPYSGFIVLRPLPQAIIGRTCLKPMNTSNDLFPTIRSNNSHLCGISFQVRTLAFQEQDAVAAKCATSALWSVFQKTGKLFQHSIPSPIEITKQATTIAPFASRAVPNEGLTDEQMGHAIKQVGLEPIWVGGNDTETLKMTAYAYLKCGIPLLMSMRLNDVPAKWEGRHAVAVTGYRLAKSTPHDSNGDVLPSVTRNIEYLFVHDDRIGPFAPVGFMPGANQLTTEWRSKADKTAPIQASPDYLIIPVYHKIRIPFQTIYETVFHLHRWLTRNLLPKYIESHPSAGIPGSFEWDIHLTTVNSFKTRYHRKKGVPPARKRRVLQMYLPRFIWRAIATANTATVFDLLFDATDIEDGNLFLCPVEIHPNMIPLLSSLGESNAIPEEFRKISTLQILRWFRDNKFQND